MREDGSVKKYNKAPKLVLKCRKFLQKTMLGPWLYTTNSHVDKKETSLLALFS